MKVLHLIKSLGRGGAEMLLPETVRMHDQSQFQFYCRYFLPWKNQVEAELTDQGVDVKCIEARSNLQLLQKYKEVAEFCRAENIDLIHAHLPWAGFVARRVHRKIGIPVVYTEHNLQDRYHFATRWINRWTFNRQSKAIAVSDDVNQSIQQAIAPKIEVHTILNGVNTDRFVRSGTPASSSLRQEVGFAADDIVVGTVAVFRFQKRLDVWLEVFANALKKEPRLRGLIVGAGPLEVEVHAKAEELGLQGKVHFAGLQYNVRPYFEAMDVFMMTSSFEGLPIALLESMSMECAVISTDAGGIKQVIRDKVDGRLTEVANPEHLSQILVDLAVNPDMLAKLKTSARQRVIEAFSIKRMVAELESIYKGLVS